MLVVGSGVDDGRAGSEVRENVVRLVGRVTEGERHDEASEAIAVRPASVNAETLASGSG